MIASTLAQADQSWNPFAQFNVTSWEPFAANLIAFVFIVIMLRVFAFKPIHEMLTKRRERIIEGEQMRKESEQQLTEIKQTTKEMLAQAGQEGKRYIEEAKQAATRLLEEKEQEASKQAGDIIEKSREAMAIESRKAQEDLKADFARLVALATSRVAGKVLDDEDQRRINEELINNLDAEPGTRR